MVSSYLFKNYTLSKICREVNLYMNKLCWSDYVSQYEVISLFCEMFIQEDYVQPHHWWVYILALNMLRFIRAVCSNACSYFINSKVVRGGGLSHLGHMDESGQMPGTIPVLCNLQSWR